MGSLGLSSPLLLKLLPEGGAGGGDARKGSWEVGGALTAPPPTHTRACLPSLQDEAIVTANASPALAHNCSVQLCLICHPLKWRGWGGAEIDK